MINRKLIFLFFISLLFCFSCKQKERKSEKEISCNLEHIKKGSFICTNSKYKFKCAYLVSSKYSKSGNNSICLSKEHPYGLSIELEDIKKDDYFEISVWRYGGKSGHLVVSDPKNEQFYKAIENSHVKSKDGWEQLVLKFNVPLTYYATRLKIYLWNSGDSNVYFDDIKIVKKEKQTFICDNNAPVLNLFISDESYQKLKLKKKEAIERGLLESLGDDYVPAIIDFEGDTLKGKLRLKGDWLDHLEGNKWSFRIKLKKKYSWKGMRTFSIHTPETRYYLAEWLTHKIFEKEDLLAPRYGFVNINLNGKCLGVYAYEEHMEKNLLEANSRREGPILKLNEDFHWYMQRCVIADKKRYKLPDYEAAVIEPFKKNRTVSSPSLFRQFNSAKELLYQSKYGLEKTSSMFDVDKIAKYYALIDLTSSHHAIIFHNQRFYYNPVLCKLEPIVYDCYSGGGVTEWPDRPIFGDYPENMIIPLWPILIYNLFLDSEFTKEYSKALIKYSDPEYISEILNENKAEIEYYEEILKTEFNSYEFNKDLIVENAKKIQEALPNYLSRLEKFNYVIPIRKEAPIKYDTVIDNLIHSYNILCFTEAKEPLQKKVKLINYSSLGIKIVGEGVNNVIISKKIDHSIMVNSVNDKPNLIEFQVSNNSNFVFFNYLNRDEIFSIPIISWSCPTGLQIAAQKISKSNNILNRNIAGVTIKGEVISFSNNVKIKEKTYIPKGYVIKIEKGTKIDLIENAAIISYSPILIKGTKENPVKIFSSDGTGMGLNIFESERVSKINYAIFDQLNTLNIEGWILTGAVNFYESDVNISNTVFKNNRCEDALNIIRSDFTISNCKFDNIFSDAFDGDFCIGTINDCFFRDVCNDAIDFSGSKVKINNCSVLKAIDKGISGGENSELIITKCTISNCNIGVASKDHSDLKLTNSTISNCQYGISAFKKKAEYESPTIELNNVLLNDVNTEYVIEEGASLILDSKRIDGVEKNVSKLFY